MTAGPDRVDRLKGDIWPFLDDHAPGLLAEYYTSGDFTGGQFDTFGTQKATPNRFTADDLVAITLLGVSMPGRGASQLMDDARFTPLLTQVREDVDLTSPDCPRSLLDSDSGASKLWEELCTVEGVGWVVANKLCARKRPQLLPVYDAVVKQALQPNDRRFWLPLWHELRDTRLVERLQAVREAAGVDDHIPLLRVLDVAIWMRNRGILQVPRDRPGITSLPFTRPSPES